MSGVDSETVRQETGWFRGYDDAWRYEIDDSKLEYNPSGFFSNPDVERYKALESKFVDASITDTELEELRTLSKNLEGVKKTPTDLQDFIKHDELFAAYPQLKDIKVSFEDMQDNGSYNSQRREITINRKLRFDVGQVKNTLLHKIQHAIQDVEGLTGGSSVEYWERQRKEIVDTINGARENLDLYLKDIGYSDYVTTSMQEVIQKKKSLSQHWVDLQKFKENSRYAKQIKNCEDEIKQYELQYDTITNGMSSTEQYFNTAGEVEARDVSDRMDYSAEQRKQTRPDIDRENVVFAEDGTESYEIKYPKFSNEDIKANKEAIAEMKPVYNVDAEYGKKNGKSPRELFSEFFDSIGNNIYSDVYGDIALKNSSVRSEVRHGITSVKLASIKAIPTVIEKGKVIFSKNKNNSDVERIIICAPIIIGNDNYYMGVMLQRDTQSQRLYLHNVVVEKEWETTSQADLLTTGALDGDSPLFITSILQDALDVKYKNVPQ